MENILKFEGIQIGQKKKKWVCAGIKEMLYIAIASLVRVDGLAKEMQKQSHTAVILESRFSLHVWSNSNVIHFKTESHNDQKKFGINEEMFRLK